MRAITVLEELANAMTDACRLADSIPDLCSRGEPVDGVVAELEQRVTVIRGMLSADTTLGRAAEVAVRELSDRVFAATARVEAMRVAVGMEMSAVTQRNRVRMAYTRPLA